MHKNGGGEYLNQLKEKSTEELRKCLMEFMGVGDKVADCVMLFSFDRLDVVPVDVHVFHIAKRDYNLNENVNHVSISRNPAIKQAFEKYFGREFCGWAHTVIKKLCWSERKQNNNFDFII